MNKHILFTLFASIILVGCNSTKTIGSTKGSALSSPILASVDLTKIVKDKAPVVINPGRILAKTVTYRLPRIVQGTYSVSDFGKYIDGFKAIDYKGNALPVTKTDTNTWVISKANTLDKVMYYVNDTFDMEINGGGIGKDVPFSPAGTNIEATNFVLNLHGFIGYFESLKTAQYKLDITAPKGMVRSSALQEATTVNSKDGTSSTTTYFAPRYFDITDNPMFYGDLDVERFTIEGIEVVLSVYSPNKKHSAAKIKKTVQTMMEAQKKYLGDINTTPRYDIFLYLSENKLESAKGFGALEHHTSTVVVLDESSSDEALEEMMTHIVAHEFFHIVTPLSVHSEDVHYFDYHKPTFSKHLWMYEGVTEYFATLFRINQGIVDEDHFYSTILGKINNAANLNDAMSFTYMSEHVLEKEYAPEYFNVYQKGALIGMCIDILMREESNGNRGVLSLMKALSLKYGKNKPFVDDDLIAEITTMTYPSVGAFLQTHVVGDTPINYNAFFEKVGLTLGKGKIKTSYIQNDGELIFEPNINNMTLPFSNAVKDNSFWTEQGVLPGDVIKTINGKPLTLQSANKLLSEVFTWKPGRAVDFRIDRNGQEIIVKTNLTQSYTTGKKLVVNPKATAKQTALRQAWLKN